MPVIKTALSADNHTNCPGRVEEAHRVHEAMLVDWAARGVDFIGLPGDWNEVPPNELDQAWSRDFLGRCAMVAPVVITPGNHDPELSLSEFHAQHEYKYPITVVTQPDVIRVETNAGAIAVACVPFVWKAHLLAKLGPLSPEESDRAAEAAMTDIFRGLGVKARSMNLPTVALIHGKWRGSKLNEEQPARPLGMEMAIEDIGMIGAQASCVGHIHLHQSAEWNGMPIFTPSSPYYVDYGESKHKKGYVYAEVPSDRTLPAKWEHIQNPVAPMLLLEYKWEGGMFLRDGQQFHEADVDATGADIRFRFHYLKAEEKTAKSAAKEIEKGLLAASALKVKLDPIPVPAATTRSLEIVKAHTLAEKARLLWSIREMNLSAEEAQVCAEMIEEVETECGFGSRLALDAGIHVKSMRMKGWRCFPGETAIDFDSVDGDVVAVSGPNGTGKSLFWEIVVLGSLYRELPTHGKIGDHAIARDTFVETTFEYDSKTYTVSQIIDGKDGTGSTSLKIGATPVFGTTTALRTEYDKWAEKNLPPLSLVKSTTFMPQESKGILGMGTKDRKALVLRAKGAERYEVLAEAAGKRANALDKELAQARARISEIGAPGGLGALQATVLRLTDEGRVAAESLRLGNTTLTDLRTKNESALVLQSEYATALTQRRAAVNERARVEEEVEVLAARILKNNGLLNEAAAITKAVEDSGSYSRSLADLRSGESELRVQQAEAVAHARDRRQELARLSEKIDGLNRSIANANRTLAEKDSILSATASVAEFTESLKETEAERDEAFKEYERLQGATTTGMSGRVEFLRGELGYIAEGKAIDPVQYADSARTADALAAQEVAERPKQVLTAKAAWQQAEQRAREIAAQLTSLVALAGRSSEIQDAERIVEEAEREIREVRSLGEELDTAITAADLAVSDIGTAITSKVATAEACQREIERLAPLVAKADFLKDVTTRIAGYEEQKVALNARLAEIVIPPVPDEPPAAINLASYEVAIQEAHRAVSTNATALALAQRELVDAEEKERRRDALVGEVGVLEKNIDRWNLVERTVGRDGLQAEAIAACGDEINERVNELLRACGNTKYTVDLKTTKLTKDGKREIEGCPINVYNSETREWQEGSTLSPGQRAFVNLPISLTLAEIGCKDSKVRPTIYLDEPTAGLDPVMRIQFMAMMRDVAKNVNAKIFFVSHNQELLDMADARMAFQDGSINIS